MPEVATAETQVAEQPADPAQEAPPTPETPAGDQPEGDAQPEAEGGEQQDYSAVEAELEAEVQRRVEERATKAEADAAKRGLQRTKEADDGESSRRTLYATARQDAATKANALRELAIAGESIDKDTLDSHMNAVMAGVQAYGAEQNETAIKALIDAALPDQTDAEKEALEPLLYDFRRNGRFDKLPATVTELALARKDAEITDLKKQLKDRSGVISAAEKLAKAREATGNGVGAQTPTGRAGSGPMTYAQLLKLPQAEQAAFIAKNPKEYDVMIGIKS